MIRIYEKIFSTNSKQGVLTIHTMDHNKRKEDLLLPSICRKSYNVHIRHSRETHSVSLPSIFDPQRLKGTVTPLNMMVSLIVL